MKHTPYPFKEMEEDSRKRTKIFSEWFWALDDNITSQVNSYLEKIPILQEESENKIIQFYKTQMDKHWDWKNMRCVGDYREIERLSKNRDYELENNIENFENFWIYLGSMYDGIMVDIHLEFFGKHIINFEFSMLPDNQQFPEEKHRKDKLIIGFLKLEKDEVQKLIDKLRPYLNNI
jgi:hypothetical protein